MEQHVHAIYENGVFRPQQPVNIGDGQRVRLTIDVEHAGAADLADVADLLDNEYFEMCGGKAGQAPALDEVRKGLNAYFGALSDLIREEREKR